MSKLLMCMDVHIHLHVDRGTILDHLKEVLYFGTSPSPWAPWRFDENLNAIRSCLTHGFDGTGDWSVNRIRRFIKSIRLDGSKAFREMMKQPMLMRHEKWLLIAHATIQRIDLMNLQMTHSRQEPCWKFWTNRNFTLWPIIVTTKASYTLKLD